MKCEEIIRIGSTTIRGWHDYKDCSHPARYKVTFPSGEVKYLCGLHLNALKIMGYKLGIEELKKGGSK